MAATEISQGLKSWGREQTQGDVPRRNELVRSGKKQNRNLGPTRRRLTAMPGKKMPPVYHEVPWHSGYLLVLGKAAAFYATGSVVDYVEDSAHASLRAHRSENAAQGRPVVA